MGVAVVVRGVQSHPLEEFLYPRPGLVPAGQPVHFQGISDDLAHPLAGVQRSERILEDHLHLAAQRTQIATGAAHQFLALEAHRARRRRHQLQDRPAQCRLAATGFAYQAECFALIQGEADSVDGTYLGYFAVDHGAGLDREMLDEVGDLQ